MFKSEDKPAEEYPKVVYVEDQAVVAPVEPPKLAVTVNSPEEEARVLKGEPAEEVIVRVPEPTIQERQAAEKVAAYDAQNLTNAERARLANGVRVSPARKASKAAKKASKKAAKPSRKAAKTRKR